MIDRKRYSCFGLCMGFKKYIYQTREMAQGVTGLAWWPEFNPRNPHVKGRKMTSASFLLTTLHIYDLTWTHTYSHFKYISKSKNNYLCHPLKRQAFFIFINLKPDSIHLAIEKKRIKNSLSVVQPWQAQGPGFSSQCWTITTKQWWH